MWRTMRHTIPVTHLLFPATDLKEFTMFRNMIFSAVVAGVLAGLLLSAVQRLQVVPIILEAETYEVSEEPGAAVSADGHAHTHSHSHDAAEEEGWAPKDGAERTSYTVLANILAGIGFSLLLARPALGAWWIYSLLCCTITRTVARDSGDCCC